MLHKHLKELRNTCAKGIMNFKGEIRTFCTHFGGRGSQSEAGHNLGGENDPDAITDCIVPAGVTHQKNNQVLAKS